jgi:NAD(P)-dependent dehydrogenase (short-subunit alcohol dehydrogenase family)
MSDLKGKTALVAGSSSGIGKATAIALAARGSHVLVVGRNEQRAKDVVAEIEGSGGYQQLINVRGIAMDARFSLLDGIPAPTQDDGASE